MQNKANLQRVQMSTSIYQQKDCENMNVWSVLQKQTQFKANIGTEDGRQRTDDRGQGIDKPRP